jgi:hypothetical protein
MVLWIRTNTLAINWAKVTIVDSREKRGVHNSICAEKQWASSSPCNEFYWPFGMVMLDCHCEDLLCLIVYILRRVLWVPLNYLQVLTCSRWSSHLLLHQLICKFSRFYNLHMFIFLCQNTLDSNPNQIPMQLSYLRVMTWKFSWTGFLIYVPLSILLSSELTPGRIENCGCLVASGDSLGFVLFSCGTLTWSFVSQRKWWTSSKEVKIDNNL